MFISVVSLFYISLEKITINVIVAQIYIGSRVHTLNTFRDGFSDSFSKFTTTFIHSFKDLGKTSSIAHQNRYMG